MQSIHPFNSIVDVGCGVGAWLKVAQNSGVEKVKGLEYQLPNKKLLHIDESLIEEYNLNEYYAGNEKYDLVISLEVAEHLKQESAYNFVKTLTGLGDVILFSAAIPGQGGQNHFNEQWPKFWYNHFESFDFKIHDFIRFHFWNDDSISPFYRQNMFIASKNKSFSSLGKNDLLGTIYPNLVHPDMYAHRSDYVDSIIAGKVRIKTGFTIFYNAIKNKLSGIKPVV